VDIGAWCAKGPWNQAHCKCIANAESGEPHHATTHTQKRKRPHHRKFHPQQKILTATFSLARTHTGGNSHACGVNTDGTHDVGLWQINTRNWNACNGGKPPCDMAANLACAKAVWGWGKNTWKYWSTCGKCGCCGST
jgi:hypothetical protein